MKGYCKLCRAKQIELYGTLVDDDERHVEACKLAGCIHPYLYPDDFKVPNTFRRRADRKIRISIPKIDPPPTRQLPTEDESKQLDTVLEVFRQIFEEREAT